MTHQNLNQNLIEKYNNWLTKAKAGDKRYMVITRIGDSWYLVSKTRAEPLKALKIAADYGDGLHPIYQYGADSAEKGDFKGAIIIKNDEKMLVSSGNLNDISAFGIEGVKSSIKALFIYLKWGNIQNLWFAHGKARKTNLVFDYAEEGDSFWYCMEDMFSIPQHIVEVGESI